MIRADDHGAGAPEELLAGLTPAQRRAVTVEAAPLCVLAAAGAGKTRVLTRRIAHRVATGSAEAPHVLVITFTRKAAGELSSRLAGLGLSESVHAGTFHSVAAGQLRRWWADRGVTPPVLLERKARLLGPLVAARPRLAGVPLAELAGHLEWARSRLVAPDDLAEAAGAARRELPVAAGELAALYRRYEDEKRRRGLVDFDDLLVRCIEAFDTDPAFASAQRWRWRHLFVDEFQDVNPLQHALLERWLGPGADLCVVGDPNQAIYGWNGADPGLLARVGQRWPSTEVVRLDDNHRCTPQIVAAAAAVLGGGGSTLASSRQAGPLPEVRSYPDDTAEARGVAAQLRAAHSEGLAWSQMAVLVRTNAQVGPICEAMGAAGVPHRTPGRRRLLDEPACADAIGQWLSAPSLPAQMAVADAEAALGAGGDSGDSSVAATEPALAELCRLARSYLALEPGGTAGGLVEWLRAAAGEGPAPGDAVTVCSFHRAKGLEWQAVWVCGLEDGLVPIGRAVTKQALEEEQRLLYVALTRAEHRLSCSWSETRRFKPGARPVPRSPSPWLAAIEDASGARRPPVSPAGGAAREVAPEEWRRHLEDQRRRLRAATGRPQGRGSRRPGSGGVTLPPPDGDLLEALRAWRSATARASGVPAHVLLHDRTLEAVASLRPATHEELVSVPGVGPVKAGRIGAALLGLLGERRASA